MRCEKCGSLINKMNHHYVPDKLKKTGKRLCLICSKEEKIITLV